MVVSLIEGAAWSVVVDVSVRAAGMTASSAPLARLNGKKKEEKGKVGGWL